MCSADAYRRVVKAFELLKECHQSISREFARIDDRTLREFLGKFDSPPLRRQVKTYGDGHVLYSLPKSVDELKGVDAVVLMAGTSPLLAPRSKFNPFTPLQTLPYWRDGKNLRSRIGSCRVHFMSWQQNFAIHGVDDAHARQNYRLLLKKRET